MSPAPAPKIRIGIPYRTKKEELSNKRDAYDKYLTAVAANGTMQQLQRVDSRCLVDCSICHYLITALRPNCPQHAHVTRTVAFRTQRPQLPDVPVCRCARSNAYLGSPVISMMRFR